MQHRLSHPPDAVTRPAFAWLPGGVATVTLLGIALAFLAAPGTFATRAHLALHGLCAQTPGHTFLVGGLPLPMDARMTGIYGGFAVAAAWLAWRRRLAAAALPGWRVGALLLGGVGLMAVDGTSSLLRDLGLPHPYAPHNLLRLGTGALTGVTLAAALCWLAASTLWRAPHTAQPPIGSVAEWARVAAAALATVALVTVAPGWAYVPVATVLLGGSLVAMATIALVAVAIARRREGHYGTFADVRRPAAVALVLGVVIMATLSGVRLAAEAAAGLPFPLH